MDVPLLDFVEVREERDRDEDDDCFFAVANVKLKEVIVSVYAFRYAISDSYVVPHEQTQIVVVAGRSSCRVYWPRDHTLRSQCWSRARKETASMDCLAQSC